MIAAGRDALRINPTFQAFLKGLGSRTSPVPTEPAEPPSTPVAVGRGAGGFVRSRAVARDAFSVFRPLFSLLMAPGQGAPSHAF